MQKPDVLLITMPWAALIWPSIQIGTIKALLDGAGVRTEARSFNLDLMEHFATADLPPEERLTTLDYTRVGDRYYSVGLGDWIFSVPPFRSEDEAWDEAYLASLREQKMPEEHVAMAQRMRRLVPSFLEQCAQEVLELGPRVVGFTTMFSQSVASLTLSKILKSRDPSIQILFGGANCDGPMGAALHRSFPWVDVVVRGEAERVLLPVVEDLLEGRTPRPQPGICIRDGTKSVAVAFDERAKVTMDEVPLPDYDEFFDRLEGCSFRDELVDLLRIPYESARGCWWGELHHCTFCGLNGSAMEFRSKSSTRVLEELRALASKHRLLDFQVVDNIIDLQHLRELLPRLRDGGHDFRMFYETKSNMKKEEVRLLGAARVNSIQPGIESLSTPILKLMRKGVTALQNIRLLKWGLQYNVEIHWNLLYGFPGEPAEEYARMADLMRSLVHLNPPTLCKLHVERFSPYERQPGAFGIELTGPVPYYRMLYPVDDEGTLSDLAYQFEYRHLDGREPDAYIGPVREALKEWREAWKEGAMVRYSRGPGFLTIVDNRRPGKANKFMLEEPGATIYLACDAGATPLAIHKKLEAGGETSMTVAEIKALLDELVEERLAYEEDGRYLSLALPEYPDAAELRAPEECEPPRPASKLVSLRLSSSTP